jgi:hypothetical protein
MVDHGLDGGVPEGDDAMNATVRRFLVVLASLFSLTAAAPPEPAEDVPFLKYDVTKTESYFSEKPALKEPAGEAAQFLARLMKAEVLALAADDWGGWQMYSHPVNQQGSRMTYMNCPDELLVALAMAAPYLDAEGKAAAKAAAKRELEKYSPLTLPYKNLQQGRLRGWQAISEEMRKREAGGPWLQEEDKAVACFKTLYGIWTYAEAFDEWDAVKALWPQVKSLKERVAKTWSFKPKWKKDAPAGPGVLTEAIATSDRYQHRLYLYLLNGTHGYYENYWPGDEQDISAFKQFSYTKVLSALIGYGRMARKMGEPDEAGWAKERFAFVAGQALSTKTAPFYWSSPWLTPEVARMLRDHAGAYLDQIKTRSNVLVGTKKDGFPNDGPWYDVIDAQHWHLAHLGSNGAFPPCAAMSGFGVQALLFNAPAEKLDGWTDIPWCQADYWYVQKCALAIHAYNRAGWTKLLQ